MRKFTSDFVTVENPKELTLEQFIVLLKRIGNPDSKVMVSAYDGILTRFDCNVAGIGLEMGNLLVIEAEGE